MRLGSVILKVDRMWYFPLLKPYHDHVPVKADLSDLEEKIAWCRAHDDECRKIGENAMAFYEKYVSRSALLDYVEMACKQMARRHKDPPNWYEEPPKEVQPPKLEKPEVPCYEDRKTGQSRLCTRCQEDYDAEVKEAKEAQERRANKKESSKERKARLRERMKKRVKKADYCRS